MRFQVKDKNIFQMPGNPHMIHLGTIGYGLREFIVMTCIGGSHKGKTYIEEAVLESKDFSKDVFACSKFIEEDALAEDLAHFAEQQGITDMKARAEELIDTGRRSWLVGNVG